MSCFKRAKEMGLRFSGGKPDSRDGGEGNLLVIEKSGVFRATSSLLRSKKELLRAHGG
jgi:hypothetical protein